jgi:hypothetical protein
MRIITISWGDTVPAFAAARSVSLRAAVTRPERAAGRREPYRIEHVQIHALAKTPSTQFRCDLPHRPVIHRGKSRFRYRP